MPRRDENPPLVRCGALPCPWEACIRKCPHRRQGVGEDSIPHALCAFYSMPGPHAPSKIAKVTGLTPEAVQAVIDQVSAKMRVAVSESRELRYDPTVSALVDDYLAKGA